jgi:hypothetical protein
MAGVQSVADALIRTFGPFLIPVTVFGIGFVGYAVLFMLNRQFRDDEEGGVVNLSAGTPEPSTTDKDHGATGRGVLPDDMSDEFSDDTGAPRGNGASPAGGEDAHEVEADKWTSEVLDPGDRASEPVRDSTRSESHDDDERGDGDDDPAGRND